MIDFFKNLVVTDPEFLTFTFLFSFLILLLVPFLIAKRFNKKYLNWGKDVLIGLLCSLVIILDLGLIINKPMGYVRTVSDSINLIFPMPRHRVPIKIDDYPKKTEAKSALPERPKIITKEPVHNAVLPSNKNKSVNKSKKTQSLAKNTKQSDIYDERTKLPEYTDPDLRSNSPYNMELLPIKGTTNQYYNMWYGPLSEEKGTVVVWTPKGYSEHDGKTYNVIEFLHGYPGNPYGIPYGLDFAHSLQKKIDRGEIPPTIVIIPESNLGGHPPTCTNSANTGNCTTWLTRDIPKMIRTTFPNATDKRLGWMIIGNSSGAYCATRMGIVAGDVYGAVVSMSGYNPPEIGFWGPIGGTVYRQNKISRLIMRPRDWPINLYVSGGALDRDSLVLATELKRVKLFPGDEIKINISQSGGHNWNTWKTEFPKVLDWWAKTIKPVLNKPLNEHSTQKTVKEIPEINYQGISRKTTAQVGWFGLMGMGTIILEITLTVLLFLISLFRFEQIWAKSYRIKLSDFRNRCYLPTWTDGGKDFLIAYIKTFLWLVLIGMLIAIGIFLVINRLEQFYTVFPELFSVLKQVEMVTMVVK